MKALNIYALESVWKDHSALDKFDYRVVSGQWTDTINGLEGAAYSDGIVLSNQIVSDFEYSSKIVVTQFKGKESGGIIFRADKKANNGYVLKLDIQKQSIILFKLGHGGKELYRLPMDLSIDQSYELKVKAVSSNMQFYLDNKELFSVKEASYSSGVFGLYTCNAMTLFGDIHIIEWPLA